MATGDNIPTPSLHCERQVLRKQAVEDASFCLTFMLYWRHWLQEVAPKGAKPSHIGKFSIKDHFITRETFLDVILMCQARILLVKLYREKYPSFRIVGDRLSSRFSEYVFQYARMAETNAPLFGVLGFKRHLRHFLLQMRMAATSGLKMPPSNRGIPNDVSRVSDIMQTHHTPAGWHLSDAEIISILNAETCTTAGREGDCMVWWGHILQCPEILAVDMARQKNIFTAPVKHFPKDDLWGAGVDAETPEQDEATREDADDEGTVNQVVDLHDPTDEATAGEIFGRVVQEGGGLQQEATGGPTAACAYKEICSVLKGFNSNLIQMAQDRKYRFQLNKMFHSQGKSVEDADKWDYYSDDDDVLVAVNVGSRGEEIVAGNVEEILVCSQAPPANSLTAGDAIRTGQPRGRVGVNYQPEKVVLLIRTYDEVNARGKILSGHGNRGRAYLHLPLLVDSPLDYYLSQHVLGHIRLKPVETIDGSVVSRMYKETHKTDRRDLVQKHQGT